MAFGEQSWYGMVLSRREDSVVLTNLSLKPLGGAHQFVPAPIGQKNHWGRFVRIAPFSFALLVPSVVEVENP